MTPRAPAPPPRVIPCSLPTHPHDEPSLIRVEATLPGFLVPLPKALAPAGANLIRMKSLRVCVHRLMSRPLMGRPSLGHSTQRSFPDGNERSPIREGNVSATVRRQPPSPRAPARGDTRPRKAWPALRVHIRVRSQPDGDIWGKPLHCCYMSETFGETVTLLLRVLCS